MGQGALRVECADDGRDGLARLGAGRYEVVIVGAALSNANTVNLVGTVRDRWPGVDVIVVSDQDRPEDVAAAIATRASAATIEKATAKGPTRAKSGRARTRQPSPRKGQMLVSLAAVTDVAAALSRDDSLDAMLDAVVGAVCKHMRLVMAGIFLVDESSPTVICKSARGMERDFVAQMVRHDGSKGPVRWVVESSRPLIIEATTANGGGDGLAWESMADRAGAFVPICYRGKLIGVMAAVVSPDRRLRRDELGVLEVVCNELGLAIENAKLSDEFRQAAERLEVVTDIIAAVHSTIDLREVFSTVAIGIAKLVDFDRATVSLLESDKTQVRVFALAASEATELRAGATQRVKGSVTNWLLTNPRPLILEDEVAGQQPPTLRSVFHQELKSAIVIPLLSESTVVGSLNLSSHKPRNYSEKHLDILRPVAEQIAIAVQKWRVYEELRLQTVEIKAAYEQLKQAQESLVAAEKLRALGELASGVAHDVNNHLAAIVLNARLLSKQTRSKKAQETVDVIKQAAMDCAHTVRRIQEFAGLRSNKPFTAVDVNQIARDVIVITRPKWRDEAQRLGKTVDLDVRLGEVVPIAGSPEDLRQALVNVVMNAVDAIGEHGQINLSTWMQGGRVHIAVRDTGSGMTEDIKQKIFDPFFTTKGSGGSGLGLSIALGIAIRHGGEITVDSEEDTGSTFTMKLPIRVPVPPLEQLVQPVAKKRVNILIIEDEAAIREALARIMRHEGHRVTVASGGAEGIAHYERGKYDIVITDLGMDGMSGWEVATSLKRGDPAAVVVMMTGWGEQLDRAMLRQNGVDLVLAKPFDSDEVLSLIERGIRLRSRDEAGARLIPDS